MQIMLVVWFAVVFVAGAVLGWLVENGRTQGLRAELTALRKLTEEKEQSLSSKEEELKAEREASKATGEELAGVRAKLEATGEKIQALMDVETNLKTSFEALAASALDANSRRLMQLSQQQLETQQKEAANKLTEKETAIETLLKPIEETIKRLDKHVEDSNLARTTAEALLDDQIKRLAGASESLTNALRKPVVRGSWGEMTLENALENAGLRAEIDFKLQHSTDAEDGRKRTDAIINLPKGRKLIIDSKNLMESYIALANAENETQRAVLAQAHAKSLRGHIKDLSSKEYWRRYEGLDCVILFIPHDGMYHAAIQDEAELIREACEKRVFITNPMSLIPLLKAVAYVLDQERANRSAEAIKKVGVELYGEVVRFAASMATLGSRLQSTVKAYNDAIPGLDRFIVSKSRTLKQLGSGKGAEAELPETIELEARPFSSPELRASNMLLVGDDEELDLAASSSQSPDGE
jgi:DNA recombination protein RmuC